MYGSWAQAKSPVWAEPDFCPVQEAQSSCPAQFGRSLVRTLSSTSGPLPEYWDLLLSINNLRNWWFVCRNVMPFKEHLYGSPPQHLPKILITVEECQNVSELPRLKITKAEMYTVTRYIDNAKWKLYPELLRSSRNNDMILPRLLGFCSPAKKIKAKKIIPEFSFSCCKR